MNYKTKVNDYLISDNNTYSEDLINELIRQGCEVDGDKCYRDFEIKELQPIIDALEKDVIKIYNDKKDKFSIFDFTADMELAIGAGRFTQEALRIIDNAYMFTVVSFIWAINDCYEVDFDFETCKYNYTIKEGKKIIMSAYMGR